MSVKAKGWKRVRLTLFGLLGFLVLLGVFWDMVPKSVFNVGKLVETIATSPKETVEDIKKIISFLFFCFLCSLSERLVGKVNANGMKKKYHGARN